jgi:hypothetical protein
MRNDYDAENVVQFIDEFVRHEEHFDRNFFEILSCMFTTLSYMCDIDADTYACDTLIHELWEDINEKCDAHFTSEDYDEFYNLMVKWIV